MSNTVSGTSEDEGWIKEDAQASGSYGVGDDPDQRPDQRPTPDGMVRLTFLQPTRVPTERGVGEPRSVMVFDLHEIRTWQYLENRVVFWFPNRRHRISFPMSNVGSVEVYGNSEHYVNELRDSLVNDHTKLRELPADHKRTFTCPICFPDRQEQGAPPHVDAFSYYRGAV